MKFGVSKWPRTLPHDIQVLLQNHLEERVLDQVQACVSYTPPFLGSFA